MKKMCLMMMALAVFSFGQTAAYGAFSGTFVGATPIKDATPDVGNTGSADGLPQAQWLDGDTTQTADLWMYRNVSGSDGWVFQSNRHPALGDSPMLVTTLSGLKAGRQYNIYVAFAKAGTNDCIYAGFAQDQLVFFNVNNTPNANIPGKIFLKDLWVWPRRMRPERSRSISTIKRIPRTATSEPFMTVWSLPIRPFPAIQARR
jgi:hypothetical protein